LEREKKISSKQKKEEKKKEGNKEIARRKAIYSEGAIDAFRDMLKIATKVDVDVKRVFATTLSSEQLKKQTGEKVDLVACGEDGMYEVWASDFFEPTISVFPPPGTNLTTS